MWPAVIAANTAVAAGFVVSVVDAEASAPGDTAELDGPDTACDITNGLLGHWTFDFGDVTSSMALDRSGNGRHGTLVGSPAPAVIAGRLGEALDFSATTAAYVEAAAVPLVATAGAFHSVSMWFFETDPTPNEVLVYLPEGPGPAPPRYDLWFNYAAISAVTLCINAGIGECWGIVDPGLVGRWVHVVAVFANGVESGSILYVDGLDAGATCVFGTCTQVRSAMGPFRIAGSEATYAWKGKLDDVRVFDRALTPAEVQTMYGCAP